MIKFDKNNPVHIAIYELLSQAHRDGVLTETATRLKRIVEEKQRDTKFIRNLNTTVYVSSKYRQGAGGEDRPKLKMSISLTPGKALEVYRLVSDQSESDKFAANIKIEIERLLADFDKKLDALKTKYGLKIDDQTENPVVNKVPSPDENPISKDSSAPAPAKKVQPTAAPVQKQQTSSTKPALKPTPAPKAAPSPKSKDDSEQLDNEEE